MSVQMDIWYAIFIVICIFISKHYVNSWNSQKKKIPLWACVILKIKWHILKFFSDWTYFTIFTVKKIIIKTTNIQTNVPLLDPGKIYNRATIQTRPLLPQQKYIYIYQYWSNRSNVVRILRIWKQTCQRMVLDYLLNVSYTL